MDDNTEDKLIITSGPDSGKTYQVWQGKTTIGSAPDNDVQLKDQGVSGFHAEIRNDDNAFFLLDFNSETGTFVNEERIKKEKQLISGDKLQLGTVHAVFLPRNGIFAKEQKPKVNLKAVIESLEPYYSKWNHEKNRKILACALPVIVVLMIVLAMSRNHPEDPNRSAAQRVKLEDSTQANPSANDAKKKKTDSARKTPATTDNGLADNAPKGETSAPAGAIGNQTGKKQQDRFADTHFSIANKFADHQLWQIALEYYNTVFEKAHDHPDLAARIAEMKSEINNQMTYIQAQTLIKKANYQKGIANLRRIPDTSYYFQKAAQVIAEAEENQKQALKSNEEPRPEEPSPAPAQSR